MVDTSFVNRGSDDALVKSLQEQGLVPEELSKAIDKSKLVQVEIQVQGKNGTFTRKQWKKAGDVKSTDKVVGGQQPVSDTSKKSSGPVDISKFKFTNYRNPDGQNYTGRETFRGTLESVAKETERKAQNVVNSYSGAMTPEKQLRIAFDNINRHSTYRDLVDPSSEQGLKDAKKAISDRQRELIESVKDLTKWDGNKWIKDDSSKSDKSKDTWQSKIDAGSFTEAEKKALSYGVSEKHACLLGKDGDYKTAKTWDEADYAVKQGWTNLGSITNIINDGKVSSNKDSKISNNKTKSSRNSVGDLSYNGSTITKVRKHGETYYKIVGKAELYSNEKSAKAAVDKNNQANDEKKSSDKFGSTDDISKDFKTFENITGRESSSVPNGTQILYGRSAKQDGNPSSEFVNADNVKKGHVKVVEHLKSQGFTVVSEHSYTPKSSYLQTTPISTGMELTITHLKDDKGSDLYVKSRVGGWSEKQFVSIITKEQGVNTSTVWDEKSDKSNHFEIPKTKDAIQKLVSSGVSKKDIMEQAKASGVTWKHNDHEGINWMRCCMAMTGTTTKGGKKS